MITNERTKQGADDLNAETSDNGQKAARPQLRRPSALVSRNLMVGSKRTSARLEPEMWSALFDISRREGRSIHEISTLVDEARAPNASLTAALRVFVMAYYRAAATEEGHARAGHGYGRVLYPEAAISRYTSGGANLRVMLRTPQKTDR